LTRTPDSKADTEKAYVFFMDKPVDIVKVMEKIIQQSYIVEQKAQLIWHILTVYYILYYNK